MYGNSAPFSYSPRGFSQEDYSQQRKFLYQDDVKSSSVQGNNTSRPSGKSIYMQRKDYSETLNQQPDNFQYRVEHLFTCELDGEEVRNLDDCVAKLKRLDAKGRLWPQEMIMEVQARHLLLSDIETKSELESLPLTCIMNTKAVLDSCAFNSLLTVTVQERQKRLPQVFIFQCEEVGAEHISSDLHKVVQNKGADVAPRRHQSDIRNNLETLIGQHAPGSFQQSAHRPVQPPPPPDHPAPQWNSRAPENTLPPPRVYMPQEETLHPPEFKGPRSSQEVLPPPEYTETQRNTDIFNHVLNDMESFLNKVTAAVNAPAPKEEKGKKKKNHKKSPKKNAPVSLPSPEECVSCLQKIKYGFNLLGHLDGKLNNPTAPDFVHILFSSLGVIVPQYPPDLPHTVLTPLLTEAALLLLSQVARPEEDRLWRSLGDCWNIPRSRWPDGDVPPNIPEFLDGWQPPPVHPSPSYQNGPMSSSSSSQRFPPGRQNEPMNESQRYLRDRQQHPEEEDRVRSHVIIQLPHAALHAFYSLGSTNHGVLHHQHGTNPSETLRMRVIYDFMARNSQELSIMKGEVVEVVNKTKQWWRVRNARGEEGHVPQNVLEPMEDPQHNLPQETRGPPPLDMASTPADVKAWLEYKGFSKITVRTLAVLNGKLLLGMNMSDIKTVCPEEGGKVFFQLQAVKSAIAVSVYHHVSVAEVYCRDNLLEQPMTLLLLQLSVFADVAIRKGREPLLSITQDQSQLASESGHGAYDDRY
ncbi:epidermal growth factor receptor kinase substrate 8-like protein 3 [Diretmus argenteus]